MVEALRGRLPEVTEKDTICFQVFFGAMKMVPNVRKLYIRCHCEITLFRFMKYLHLFFALLFGLGAVVQLNDPDPWLWVVLYLLVAAVAGAGYLDKWKRPLLYIATVGCLIGLGIAFPGFWDYVAHHMGEDLMQGMSDERMYIEETREFLGMGIALAVLGFYWFQFRQSMQPEIVIEEDQ